MKGSPQWSLSPISVALDGVQGLQKGLGAYLADPKVRYDGDELAELARMIEEAKNQND